MISGWKKPDSNAKKIIKYTYLKPVKARVVILLNIDGSFGLENKLLNPNQNYIIPPISGIPPGIPPMPGIPPPPIPGGIPPIPPSAPGGGPADF